MTAIKETEKSSRKATEADFGIKPSSKSHASQKSKQSRQTNKIALHNISWNYLEQF